MTIDPELLAIIRCPISGEPLREADAATVQQLNARIAAGKVEDRGQRTVDQPVAGLLVSESSGWMYPIRETIPTLIPDWAIAGTAGPEAASQNEAPDHQA